MSTHAHDTNTREGRGPGLLDDDRKVVIDEQYIRPRGEEITEQQIRLLLGEATSGSTRDANAERICRTALEGPIGLREIARGACVDLWEQRQARLRARRQPDHLYGGGDEEGLEEDDDLGAEAFSGGGATACIEIMQTTSLTPRRPAGVLPGAPSTSARLFEFPCPICHRPVFGEDDAGALRIPSHRISMPVFPYGFGKRPHEVQCPMSGCLITEACDGEHDAPSCGDPGCWHGLIEQYAQERPAEVPHGVVDANDSFDEDDQDPGGALQDDQDGLDGRVETDGTIITAPLHIQDWTPEETMTNARAIDPEGDSRTARVP